jgi:hypothetical protein
VTTGSQIQWTQATWNPVTGCDRISAGCDHGDALALAGRLKAMGQAKYQTNGKAPTSGPEFGVATHPDTLAAPLGWRRPRLVFVTSMSDFSVGVDRPRTRLSGVHRRSTKAAVVSCGRGRGRPPRSGGRLVRTHGLDGASSSPRMASLSLSVSL